MAIQFGNLTGRVGEYNLGRTLGQGTMGKVKIGEKDGEYFAVKILKKWAKGRCKLCRESLKHSKFWITQTF